MQCGYSNKLLVGNESAKRESKTQARDPLLLLGKKARLLTGKSLRWIGALIMLGMRTRL